MVDENMPKLDELKGRRIGRVLTKMGKVTRDQVHEALDLQTQRRMPMGQLLTELGYVTSEDVNRALAAQAGLEAIDLSDFEIDQKVMEAIPAETVQSYQVVPIEYDEGSRTLTIALKSADNFRAVDDLSMLMGYNVKAVVASPSEVDACLAKFYGESDESIMSLIDDMVDDETFVGFDGRDASIDLEKLSEAAEDNKVIRLVNLVLLQAIKDKASDVHFEPFESEFKMRYRIDGVLYEMVPPPPHLAPAIVSRVKVLAKLDIAEHRMPQDGRIELSVAGNPVDLRISVLPTIFGESVVMRILDRSNVELDLEKLGLREDDLETFRYIEKRPNGIVIVTGPTGSGKTTTLYAALNELNSIETKILTIEDPVEYDLDGMLQVQVNEDIGMTFGRALRSFLRQDPDIILVGEIRDLETAKISVESALTGHLVFSTLHTNDAPSSIARLIDLGLEPFLVTATVEAIVGQRLVRRICPYCKESYEPTEEQLMELDLTPDEVRGREFYRGKGCVQCNRQGLRGRVGLYEIMVLSDELREMIMADASTNALRNVAKKSGMRTLREAGLLAIYDGFTTIEEVVRETMMEED